MTGELERQIINLVATDRLYRPSSSFDGKLERRRPKLAQSIASYDGFDGEFQGDRAYARLVTEDRNKARDVSAGIRDFTEANPEQGAILQDYINKSRKSRERHLYFGMNDGCRVAHEDYMAVLTNMGLSEQRAEQYLAVAMDISRNLQKNSGDEERSVIVKN